MKAAAAVALSVLFSVPLVAKDKPVNLEWRTGALLDQASEPRCHTSGFIGGGAGSVDTTCITLTFYTIDAGDMTYTLSRSTLRRDQPLSVTVNTTVKFASSGDKWFIQDELGKSHEVRLVKKALNTSHNQ